MYTHQLRSQKFSGNKESEEAGKIPGKFQISVFKLKNIVKICCKKNKCNAHSLFQKKVLFL